MLLKNALDEAGQREALEWALRHGIDRRAWLDEDGALNAPRQFRGRCYDAVEAVDRRAGALSDALQEAARKAYKEVDPVGASTTHLLMLFYANLERGLGWHRDNGRFDGQRLDAGRVAVARRGVLVPHEARAQRAGDRRSAGIGRRDLVRRAGAPRHALRDRFTKGHVPGASPRFGEGPRAGRPGRVAAEFDVAPRAATRELRGLEGGDRFHILGAPTATFVAAAREKGLDAARAEANARKRARKQKKARRRFGTDCALGAGCDRPCCAPDARGGDFREAGEGGGEPPPPAYLMVLYLVGPVALGSGRRGWRGGFSRAEEGAAALPPRTDIPRGRVCLDEDGAARACAVAPTHVELSRRGVFRGKGAPGTTVKGRRIGELGCL